MNEPRNMPADPVHQAAYDLLGCLYQQPSLWADVRLRRKQMPTSLHAALFTALRRLNERGAEPTRALVQAEAGQVGADIAEESIRWLSYSGRPKNLDEYQRVVERWNRLRRLKLLHRSLADHIENGDPDAGWAALNQTLAEPRPTGAVDASDVLWEVLQEMEDPTPPVPTGVSRLDGLLDGGLRPGDVFVLAARPSVGKSAFALQMALHMATSDMPVMVWSLEMSAKQWMRRALSYWSSVDSRHIKTGRMSEVEQGRIARASDKLNKALIRFADATDTTPSGFRLAAIDAVRQQDVKALIIDYLQLMQPKPDAWSRENEVATLSRTLKVTAVQFEVPIIVLAQLNREAENRVPTLRNLRESGAIEQDADQVFFLHREMDEETSLLKPRGLAILAKHRDGATGSFRIEYDAAHYRFKTLAPEPEYVP